MRPGPGSRHLPLTLVVLLALSASLLTGCSGDGSDAGAAAPASAAPAPGPGAGDAPAVPVLPDGVELVGVGRFAELAAIAARDESVRVLDLRTDQEVAGGTIPGASQLDFYAADFGERLAALDRDTTWLIYCNSGNRTRDAARMMRSAGFASVADLDGGWQAWVASGRA